MSLDDLRRNVTIRTCIMLARQIKQRSAAVGDTDNHQLASLILDNLDLLDIPNLPDNGNVVRFPGRAS